MRGFFAFLWRWSKRAIWVSLALFVGFLALGIAITATQDKPREKTVSEILGRPVASEQPQMVGKYAERSAEPSREGRLSRAAIGCLQRGDHERLSDVAVQGDEAAFEKLKLRLVVQGACRILSQGQYVHITETALFAGLHAVRPTGEPDALWVDKGSVKRLPR